MHNIKKIISKYGNFLKTKHLPLVERFLDAAFLAGVIGLDEGLVSVISALSRSSVSYNPFNDVIFDTRLVSNPLYLVLGSIVYAA